MKLKAAKFIRILTVPPIMAGALILILALRRGQIFRGPADILLAVICLMVLPVLAYPLQPFIPGFRDKGRKGQRNLAFVCTIIGYTAGVIIGCIFHVSAALQFVLNVYLLSVVLLTFFNKVLHIKASGHACSVAGPLVMLIYQIGPVMILPCVLIGGGVVWSSLVLKRHTLSELGFGALTSVLSFFILLGIGILAA